MEDFTEIYEIFEPLLEQLTAKYTDSDGNIDKEALKAELIATLEEAEELYYLNQITCFKTETSYIDFPSAIATITMDARKSTVVIENILGEAC
jgi:hypothetical protein